MQTLRKALALKPDLIEAQRGIVMLELDAGRTTQAVAMAREVQKQRPKESIGYVLEGDAYVYKKSWSRAATAYRTGLKQAGTDLAMKLHAVLIAAGKRKEADQFATSWIKEHPKDMGFQALSCAGARSRGTTTRQRRASIEALLDMQPNNPMLLNNLAWAAGQIEGSEGDRIRRKGQQACPGATCDYGYAWALLVEKGDTARRCRTAPEGRRNWRRRRHRFASTSPRR